MIIDKIKLGLTTYKSAYNLSKSKNNNEVMGIHLLNKSKVRPQI